MHSVHYLLCLVLAISFSTSLAQDGYEIFPTVPGSRYRLYSFSRTWVEALNLCKEDGDDAHLVVINSEAEADIVKQLFEQVEVSSCESIPHLAVGINDLAMEGTWVTVTGELVSESGYENWGGGEPRDGVDQNCGVVNRNVFLASGYCANARPFICEKPNA